MFRRLILAVVLLVSLGVSDARAQLCVTSHTTDLYCLLPTAFHTATTPFEAFYTPFGTQLSELPTAKPAGLILVYENGVLEPGNESLGTVFSERAETIGSRRIFAGFTFQHFNFSSIDGTDLNNLPIILKFSGSLNGTPDTVYTVTTNKFNITANQYTFLAAYGMARRLDLSVSVPIQQISMSVAVNGHEYEQLYGATTPISEYVPGTSSGIGDVVVGAKAGLYEGAGTRIAVGTDVRIPSGDELNFLGSGAVGIKPYVAISRHGSISPHANLGYQWNGDTILNPYNQGQKQPLPSDLFYTAGADVTLKHFSIIADLLGQAYFNAPRLAKPTPYSAPVAAVNGAPSVTPYVGSYLANNLSLGFKTRVFSHFILTGNVLLKLDSGGLRSTVVPLAGVSYSF